jgi:hypothetical protein
MVGMHRVNRESVGVDRARLGVLVLLALGPNGCGGSHSSGASSGGGAGSSSDEGGILFAQGPPSSGDDDSGDVATDAPLDASAETSLDGSADAEADTFTCDATLSPREAPCVINDAFAVFVAPPSSVDGGMGGSDVGGNGSMALPFATIGKALANLGGKSRVLLCNAVYPEAVSIDVAHSASLYGGLSCAATAGAGGLVWRYEGGVAEVRPAAAAPAALTISGAPGPLAIEDMGFESPSTQVQDSSGAGASSIAAWIGSSVVSFSRVVLTADDAGNGADGTMLVNYDPGAPTAPAPVNSVDALSQACPPGTMSPPADSTAGGQGAIGGPMGLPGSAYPAPLATAPRDGLGGLGDQGDYAEPGHDGADGFARNAGIRPSSLGTLSGTAWSPTPGGDGAAGTPGQGGGGGGRILVPGSTTIYDFGGGGGTGGCGGGGGTGGKGGGASVALFSVSSTVMLTACQLVSNQAGKGGNGGLGAPGQAGSLGRQVLYSGSGGMGGNGAGGSGGAGGTGGVSAGIMYRGSEPTRDAATIISLGHGLGLGAAGDRGNAGEGGGNASGLGTGGIDGAVGLPGAYFAVHDVDAP